MNNKAILALLGFVVFFFGFLSMILYLFAGGLRLSFLSFIDNFGQPAGFIIRVVMIFGGMIMFYISRTDNELE